MDEMLMEFVERYPESLNDTWDVFNNVCWEIYDVEFDRELIEKKCISFGIPYALVQYIVSDSYNDHHDGDDFKWLLTDEHGMPLKGNIELGIAKNIKMVADNWLEHPEDMYNDLFELMV